MASDDDLTFVRGVRIPLSDLVFEFSRGSGPGGQNVNKVNSKVTLRWNIAGAMHLSDDIRAVLLEKLKTRVTNDGELVLHASEYRDQPKNREAAIARLVSIVSTALHREKARKKTRPSRGSVERRIQASKRKSAVKKMRRPPPSDD